MQIMTDQQVNTGAVALEAQLLVIALQKPLMDGVGDGLDGGLELLPVGIIQGHVQPDFPAQTLINRLPAGVIGGIEGVAQMYVSQQAGGIAIVQVAGFQAGEHSHEVCVLLPGHTPLMGQLMGHRGGEQAHREIGVHAGLPGEGEEKAGEIQITEPVGAGDGLGADRRAGKPGMERFRVIIYFPGTV